MFHTLGPNRDIKCYFVCFFFVSVFKLSLLLLFLTLEEATVINLCHSTSYISEQNNGSLSLKGSVSLFPNITVSQHCSVIPLTSISSYYYQEHLMQSNIVLFGNLLLQQKTKAIKLNSKSNCCCQRVLHLH